MGKTTMRSSWKTATLEAAANTAHHIVCQTIIYFAAGARCAQKAISISAPSIRKMRKILNLDLTRLLPNKYK
jgi:hypothetical protein